MDALKITSQEHQILGRVIHSRKEVVIITYVLRVHKSIIMRRRRRRHIASAVLTTITVVCTSTPPRVVSKCGLTITAITYGPSSTLCSIFRHGVVVSPLILTGHPCHQPRPPHLPHFLVSSSSRRCPRVLTVVVIVALAHAHHTAILMCRLTVSTAYASSSPLPVRGNYFLVLFPSCCCSCVHVGGHG